LSLTAPTGSGKTLTIFMFANLLRKKIFNQTNRTPRIIYVSPFLSIIDQNAEVISKCLGIDNYEKQSPLMITHHHHAPLVYEDESNESYSNFMSQLLIEGWNTKIIVTTMVQFLETLIGCRVSSLRKLNIIGSIVILDEVQSIDYKHWQLIHYCLEFLENECDTIIILMTATQP
jgi:CRISPR-associated endonuclease/helicase Cas3